MADSEAACRDLDIRATRAFFGSRAAGWEERFPDDGPLYDAAVAELAPPAGGVVLDVACGTGRALEPLRAAVGAAGTVIGLDVTTEMISEAVHRGRDRLAELVLADARRLPLGSDTLDAVFAAGLLPHIGDPIAGLRELARVCRPGARLALFHPIGRADLAHRHGHQLAADDIRREPNIRAGLAAAGWRCELVDDSARRYLVLAVLLGS